MVGTRTATGNRVTASLRFELVGRLTGRLGTRRGQPDTGEVARIALADARSRNPETDPRQPYLEQYRELTATPVRWVRLT